MKPSLPLPPTAQLLLEGGDDRLALQERVAVNKYGCSPRPDPSLVALGSSTATSVSVAGFEAADRLRQRLAHRGVGRRAEDLHREEADRIKDELKSLCGLSSLRGLQVALAASGTDLHLMAAQWLGGIAAPVPLIIMMDGSETGSGVAAALGGRHFSGRCALGDAVVEGAPIDGGILAEVAQVAIRHADGAPRALADVHADIDALVARTAQDRRVLLVSLDVSKTGMLVPAPTYAAALRHRLGGRLDVMVDACQFRLASQTLRRYLEAGFLVATTGSKFITGPSFCGALFIPDSVATRLCDAAAPRGLHGYCLRADWPGASAPASWSDDASNFGLLLRWEAALAELRAFRRVPLAQTLRVVQDFAAAVSQRLAGDPAFEPVHVGPLDRGPFGDPAAWDRIPTIFPFVLYRRDADGHRHPLTREQTLQIYRLMPGHLEHAPEGTDADLGTARYQLGQPVACGSRDGVPVSALRVCASARLVVDGATRAADATRLALAALDKAARLVEALYSSRTTLHHD